jgi:hypothetical protein
MVDGLWIETTPPPHHEYPRTKQVPNSASDYVVATEPDKFEPWLEATMAMADTSVMLDRPGERLKRLSF